MRIFKRDEARQGEVIVIGAADCPPDVFESQGRVRLDRNRSGMDAADSRCAACLRNEAV